MCLTRRSPVSAASTFENWLTTVRIVVCPADGGSPVTKSILMYDQGPLGMGSGLRSTAGGQVEDFPLAHTGEAATKDSMSSDIEGHQNHWRKLRVQTLPG